MTGISDVARSARSLKRSFYEQLLFLLARCIKTFPIPQFYVDSAVLFLTSNSASKSSIGSMPKPLLGYFQEKSASCNPFRHKDNKAELDSKLATAPSLQECQSSSCHKWGILLPVCFRGRSDEQEKCMEMFKDFVSSLDDTVGGKEERSSLHIIVGIDTFDILYDSEETQKVIVELFSSISINQITFVQLRSHYRGKLCRIWDYLAGVAVAQGCDFFVLLGDDIRFQSKGWKADIEEQFRCIASTRGLPFGVGCVAFRDTSFNVFPTFPVIHRMHMQIFGTLFPIEFINQHGDPYLFEVYRRWGASEFSPSATLANTIGGSGTARYSKHNIHWRGDILTNAVTTLADFLDLNWANHLHPNAGKRFHCLNVVVPSYRCDVHMLQTVTSLKTSIHEAVSVHMIIVVDNPTSPQLPAVRKLEDWSPNHLVRIYENAENMGASLSRNTGMASSFGDYVVLLDDDVIPDPSILDAYLGAILRHPDAKIFVGLTRLPPPITWMQKALMASQMTFFYDVALRMSNPSWGITANLCVEGRTNNHIWFSDKYPKTGGGEDVDFCLRMKDLQPPHLRNGLIVAVPEAVVQHPFWSNIPKQIVGWALGDVKCLSALPHQTFYTLPNWIEFILFCTLLSAILGFGSRFNLTSCEFMPWLCWIGKVAVRVIVAEVVLTSMVAYPHTFHSASGKDYTVFSRTFVSLLAAFPVMMQDFARLLSKLWRGQLHHICLQFDWMDGQRQHVPSTVFASRLKTAVFLMMISWDISSLWFCISNLFLLLTAIMWCQGQYFSPEMETAEDISRLKPVPIDFTGSPGAPFVVLAWQRTGSNLLCGKLHNHFQIVMHNEIFNDAKIWTYQNEDVRSDATWKWNVFSRDADPVSFLKDLFLREPLEKKQWKAVGFKLFPDHWRESNEQVLQQLLADKRVKKIILRRDNYLDVYTSKLRADKTGHYIHKSLDEVKLQIDLSSFQSFVKHYEACYAYYDSLVQGQEVLRVSYDQLVGRGEGADKEKDAAATMTRVLTFLGVDSTAVPPPLDITVKQSKLSLQEGGIVNYNEVQKAFSTHPVISKCFENIEKE